MQLMFHFRMPPLWVATFAVNLLSAPLGCSAFRATLSSSALASEGEAAFQSRGAGHRLQSGVRVQRKQVVPGHTELGNLTHWRVQADPDGMCHGSLRKVLAFLRQDDADGRSDAQERQEELDILGGGRSAKLLDEIMDVVSRSDFERQMKVGELITLSDLNHLVECEIGQSTVRLEEGPSVGNDEEMIEGDILVSDDGEGEFIDSDRSNETAESFVEFGSNVTGSQRWAGYLWPGGAVPYCFQKDLPSYEIQLFRRAVQQIMQKTCLKFSELEAVSDKQCSSRPSIMVKNNKPGCNSFLGRKILKWNSQRLNLEQGCHVIGVVLHEIGHAIGLTHEHSRYDRDETVTVHWENIQPEYKRWYEKEWNAYTGDPYDYKSLMHYSAYEFAKGGKPTMTGKHGEELRGMGQRAGFSPQDYAQINEMYNC